MLMPCWPTDLIVLPRAEVSACCMRLSKGHMPWPSSRSSASTTVALPSSGCCPCAGGDAAITATAGALALEAPAALGAGGSAGEASCGAGLAAAGVSPVVGGEARGVCCGTCDAGGALLIPGEIDGMGRSAFENGCSAGALGGCAAGCFCPVLLAAPCEGEGDCCVGAAGDSCWAPAGPPRSAGLPVRLPSVEPGLAPTATIPCTQDASDHFVFT